MTNLYFLIVEDDERHAKDAMAACDAVGIDYNHHYVCSTLELARETLGWEADRIQEGKPRRFDGVLTDIFMPEGLYPSVKELIPGGVSVALQAEELGIPFVFCTSGYHHGHQYNWICDLARHRSWPEMVDILPNKDEKGSKDWAKAIQILRELIESRSQIGAG